MTYSSIGILAFFIMLIIDHDVFWKTSSKEDAIPALKQYRYFLLSVMLYYIADILWGYLHDNKLITAVYIDTVLYFASMALVVLFWSRYVVAYINDKSPKRFIVYISGFVFFLFEASVIIINLFEPILFWFDDDGVYHPEKLRYATFFIQIVMFLITALYMLYSAIKRTRDNRLHYMTIGFFSVVVVVFNILQFMYPLLPFYAIGYLLGTCILHSFILEVERERQRRFLKDMLEREQKQRQELGSARHMALTDPLTGVKNKHAYLDALKNLDSRISEGELRHFGVVVFDLNGLKVINDTLGHEAGDLYIKNACEIICRKFKHSPVFRIGGDEFVALLEGEDYENRLSLMSSFNRTSEDNLRSGTVVISAGMDVFHQDYDESYSDVFERADKRMYERKKILKEMAV